MNNVKYKNCYCEGKNNPNYKDGRSLKKYYCKECGAKIIWQTKIYGSGLCRKCAGKVHSEKMKGANNPSKRIEVRIKIMEQLSGWKSHFYKDGRCSKIYYCKDCGKEISRKSELGFCKSCWCKGSRSPNWIADRNLIKNNYGAEFNNALKEQVRFRDGYKCKICGCSQLENGKQLDVHHIDYDKKNNDINNLVSLCKRCHTKTNSRRDYWVIFLKKEK